MVFCAWDAEEYGLIGSSEFIEVIEPVLSDIPWLTLPLRLQQYLRRFETKAIAYLNVDIAVTGEHHFFVLHLFLSAYSESFRKRDHLGEDRSATEEGAVPFCCEGCHSFWMLHSGFMLGALFQVPNPNPAEVQAGRKTVYDTWVYKQPDKKHPPEPW